ncbi:putative nadh-ubiquinone oxidoreductase 19 kda [Phaeomoniella chlamydospora]|uniref:Putative nadh-ubiquinone oxidoreductase 19 kDa n=1 Tax=Phaeomoniella chlamydospora TaxID=158046 RepID=A0A0G2ERZ6_PHACM|nr:putative nadh-ubiquinone oxidoreductase 19 kda [Phaeomoniella chlamydospora]
MAAREPRFAQKSLVDPTPMPSHIPPVEEIGASSAPLASASFFIGARCKPYNDDFMQCKTEANGRGEVECLKEGRKVTRCAASVSVYPFPSHFVWLSSPAHGAMPIPDITANGPKSPYANA